MKMISDHIRWRDLSLHELQELLVSHRSWGSSGAWGDEGYNLEKNPLQNWIMVSVSKWLLQVSCTASNSAGSASETVTVAVHSEFALFSSPSWLRREGIPKKHWVCPHPHFHRHCQQHCFSCCHYHRPYHRHPEYICPRPCFHRQCFSRCHRHLQKVHHRLYYHDFQYCFICHHHLLINQSDKKHLRSPKCARADRTYNHSAKLQPPIPMSSAWGFPKARGGLFLWHSLCIRNRNCFFGEHLRWDISSFAY